jgi:tetratricopeptide (TPR) repeat protein
VTYSKIGEVQPTQGDLAEGLKSFGEAIAVFERLAKAQPDSIAAQRDLAVCHGALAGVLARHGETARALAEFRIARTILENLPDKSADPRLPALLASFEAEIAKLEQGRPQAE